MSYWSEFLTMAVAHALAVASPGPDFALVLKQSIARGRRTAIWTSLGIGAGISLHVAYSLLGISLLIANSAVAFNALKYAGAAYLAWIGIQALRTKPRRGPVEPAAGRGPEDEGRKADATRSAFATGFLTNALNPKATLFFLALFPMVVSPATPKLVQLGYGLWVIGYTAGWFTLVSLVFTRPEIRNRFLRQGHWIDRALGVVFLGFAASLAFATLR
ncbi:MAG TPA: LysE family transporter [Opitutaceae bacterium]|nr:LysE family transporter [Opitutaceae bacterium]